MTPPPKDHQTLWQSIPRTTRRVLVTFATVAFLAFTFRPDWLAKALGAMCAIVCLLAPFALMVKVIGWGFGSKKD